MLINHPPDGATCIFVFNSNRQVALCIDALFIIVARGHLYFHRTVQDRTALDVITVQFDLYCACICANCRLSAQVFTFPLTYAVKLLIYCRLAADVRVWRRCSVVGVRCRPDVEGGLLIRSISANNFC